jgi:hypothetical protein
MTGLPTELDANYLGLLIARIIFHLVSGACEEGWIAART